MEHCCLYRTLTFVIVTGLQLGNNHRIISGRTKSVKERQKAGANFTVSNNVNFLWLWPLLWPRAQQGWPYTVCITCLQFVLQHHSRNHQPKLQMPLLLSLCSSSVSQLTMSQASRAHTYQSIRNHLWQSACCLVTWYRQMSGPGAGGRFSWTGQVVHRVMRNSPNRGNPNHEFYKSNCNTSKILA